MKSGMCWALEGLVQVIRVRKTREYGIHSTRLWTITSSNPIALHTRWISWRFIPCTKSWFHERILGVLVWRRSSALGGENLGCTSAASGCDG